MQMQAPHIAVIEPQVINPKRRVAAASAACRWAWCPCDRAIGKSFGLAAATPGLTRISQVLRDNRTGKNTRHSLAALLRQSIYSRLAGYDDTNDAECPCVDPAMRHIAGGRAIERSAASTSAMGRCETEILSQSKNLGLLMNLAGEWVDRAHQRKSLKQIILDMDSSVSPTYGSQEGTAYNGCSLCMCYHPLFCFNQYGDWERALLRNGNVHSADDWRSLLEPIANRYRGYDILRFFRGDVAFADPRIYRYFEAEGYWTRLSCHDFVDNQVRLQLFALAYNIGSFLRRLALPKSVKQWSLRTLRDKLIKIGAKVVSRSRCVIFQMAEVAIPQMLFRESVTESGSCVL